MSTPEDQLVLNSFIFNEQAGIIICTTCQHGIDNLRTLRSHLSTSKHSDSKQCKITAKLVRSALLMGTVWEKYIDTISELPKCFGGNVISEDQMRYRNAHTDTSSPLPRIEELPLRFGYSCDVCASYCCTSDAEMADHFTQTHSLDLENVVEKLRSFSKIAMQSLGQGSRQRFFPVIVPSVVQLVSNGNIPEPEVHPVIGLERGPSSFLYESLDLVSPLDFEVQDAEPSIDLQAFPPSREWSPHPIVMMNSSDEDPNRKRNVEVAVLHSDSSVHQVPVQDAILLPVNNPDAFIRNLESGAEKADMRTIRDNSVEAAFDSILQSINPSKSVQKTFHDAQKEYTDVPLHALVEEMDKIVSDMLKRTGFSATLLHIGFRFLGSVVTALCFPSQKMKKTIQTHFVVNQSNMDSKITGSLVTRVDEQHASKCVLGKANSPLISLLNGINQEHARVIESGNATFSNRVAQLDATAPVIATIEHRIVSNIKSYLKASAVVTTLAPNFIRSMVIAHNGSFTSVSSRRSFVQEGVRRDRSINAGIGIKEAGQHDGTNLSRVSFFKVLTTKKSMNSYGNDISLLVLMTVRLFLVRRNLGGDWGGNLENEGEFHMNQIAGLLGMEIQAEDKKELYKTMIRLLSEDARSLDDAVKVCLCSVGFCLHTDPRLSCSLNKVTEQNNLTAPHAFLCFSQHLEIPWQTHNVSPTSFGHCEKQVDEEDVTSCAQDGVAGFTSGQIAIHWILRDLLLRESNERNSTRDLFVSKFMAIVSVSDPVNDVKQRKFLEAHLLTPITNAIGYAMKCCGVIEMSRSDRDWNRHLRMENVPSGLSRERTAEPVTVGSRERREAEKMLQDDGNRFSAVKPPHGWIMTHEQVSRCFSTCHNTVASYLFGVHNALRECAEINNDVKVRFIECNRKDHGIGRCGLVDGKECSLDTLSAAVRKWQTQAYHTILNDLLLGMKIPDGFDNMTALLHDDFRDCRRGASFCSLQKNATIAKDYSLALMKHIMASPQLRLEFFITNTVGEQPDSVGAKDVHTTSHIRFSAPCSSLPHGLKVRAPRVQQYLDYSQKLQKILLACLHVTSGGTARSTELEYLFKNTAEQRRNVFILQGEIVFIARYNKNGSAKSKGDIIARFPDRETSKLFLIFFLLIRPTEEFFVRSIHGDNAAEMQGSFCFVDMGKKFSSEKCRDVIVELFNENNVPFTFQEFRHYQIYMARKHLSGELLKIIENDVQEFHKLNRVPVHPIAGYIPESAFDAVERETTGGLEAGCPAYRGKVPDLSSVFPIHQQAGHAIATADKVYGLSTADMSGLGKSKLEGFRSVSRAWQATLGLLDSSSKMKVTDGSRHSHSPKNPTRQTTLAKRIASQVPLTEGQDECVRKNFKKSSSREASHFQEEGGKKALHSLPSQHQYSLKNSDETIKGQSSYRDNSAGGNPHLLSARQISFLLTSLRRMKKSETAQFKSTAQLYAVQSMLEKRNDLFVIMPTGHGKTDMILLASWIERFHCDGSFITVIIVPIIALSRDILRRCDEIGIRALIWSNQADLELVDILVVSVEQVETHPFAKLIGEQANKGALARIIMEECQTTGRWDDFRPSYSSLKGNIRPGGLPVQVVLASATVPPRTTTELAYKHGVSHFQEIRLPTERQNLSYRVQQISCPRFKALEDHICEKGAEVLRELIIGMMSRQNHTFRKGQIILYCPTRRIRAKMSETLSTFTIEGVELSMLGYDSSLAASIKLDAMDKWTAFHKDVKLSNQVGYGQELTSKTNASARNGMLRSEDPHLNESDEHKNQEPSDAGRPSFQIMVATCGFGMGIDSPCVRAVLHLGYARSLTEYAQESGRAGRDGNTAQCLVLFSQKLLDRERLIASSTPSEELESMRLDAATVPNLDFTKRRYREVELSGFEQWAKNNLCCRKKALFGAMDTVTPEICLFTNMPPILDRALCDFCDKLNRGSIDEVNCTGEKPFPIRTTGADDFKAGVSPIISRTLQQSKLIFDADATKKPLIQSHSRETASVFPLRDPGSSSQCRDVLSRFNAQIVLRTFKGKCQELQEMCLVCLVVRGVRRPKEQCDNNSCRAWRCFRCLQSSHSSGECELIPFRPMQAGSRHFAPKETERKNHCYACGLNMWMRVRLHIPKEFSKVKNCPYIVAFRLAAIAWDSNDWRALIISKFSLSKIEALDNPQPGLEDVLFFKWLQEESTNDNGRLNLMRVMDFILLGKESAGKSPTERNKSEEQN